MICVECAWKHRDETRDHDWSKLVLGKCEKCGETRPVFGKKEKGK